MTERDQSRDRPGDQMTRLTVAEAARSLGISEAGVRKRVQRNQIAYEHDDDGRLFVWVSPGETRRVESRDRDSRSRDELLEELRDRIRYLERQVEEEQDARRRADTLLARLMDRVPELEPPNPTETPPETREYAVTPQPQPERTAPERVEPEKVETERVKPAPGPRESPTEPASGADKVARPTGGDAQNKTSRRSWLWWWAAWVLSLMLLAPAVWAIINLF
jgi:hypothetical protein